MDLPLVIFCPSILRLLVAFLQSTYILPVLYLCAEPYVREVGRSDLGRYTCEAENTVGRAQAAILLSGTKTRPRKFIAQQKMFYETV